MKTCNYCKEPHSGLGAEHLKCALRHPHWALLGWFFYLAGGFFCLLGFISLGIEDMIKIRVSKDGEEWPIGKNS